MGDGPPGNAKTTLRGILDAHRHLTVLRTLRDCGGMANERLLRDIAAAFGLAASRQDMRSCLDLLEREGLLQAEDVDGVRVVRLTASGDDVALGRLGNQWVAVPEPDNAPQGDGPGG